MVRFVADPAILHQKGAQIASLADSFKDNEDKLYETISTMISSSYTSPEANAIAKKIADYKPDLDYMNDVMVHYANFCGGASSKVIRNQDNIISEIK